MGLETTHVELTETRWNASRASIKRVEVRVMKKHRQSAGLANVYLTSTQAVDVPAG
jgi:stress response protein YsnF